MAEPPCPHLCRCPTSLATPAITSGLTSGIVQWRPAHGQCAGRGEPHDLLGHQELRRRRQLPGPGDMAAGAAIGLVVASGRQARARGYRQRDEVPIRVTWLPVPSRCTPGSLRGWRCCRCSLPLARRSMPALYYGVPGWNQLHSPFRWVFPFTLSMIVLAAGGLDGLLDAANLTIGDRQLSTVQFARGERSRFPHRLGRIGGVALVAASYFMPARFIAVGQRLVDGSDLAQMAFADGRMFWSYQAAESDPLWAGRAGGRGTALGAKPQTDRPV